MRALPPRSVALAVVAALLVWGAPHLALARVGQARGQTSHRAPPASGPRLKGAGAKVAVQPFDGPGPDADELRSLVVRIVRGRGFRPMTSLPRYDGTGQYPILARDHTLAAFVTADMEERGTAQRITFLVWNGVSGSVVGRWTASAPSPVLARAVGRGFWQHLGPAIMKSRAPAPKGYLPPAAPMRIDASAPSDTARAPVAARE
ncbi:MAG: hypothetical protein ABJA82_02270 [Myxococcales bacterium]